MKTLGICFGATTIQAIELAGSSGKKPLSRLVRAAHEGNPREGFIRILKGFDLQKIDAVAVTGRNFRKSVTLSGISEPEAIEYAAVEEYSGKQLPELIISAGGETQLIYKIGRNGGVTAVFSGNKCASGTGEFFLQQIRRMGLSLDDAVEMASRGIPHKIAGRCSVFCKSDCTHALNKGEARENIVAGLCVMMADKLTELMKNLRCERISLIGGGSLNSAIVSILRSRFTQLDVPPNAAAFEAFGAALWAARNPCAPFPSSIDSVFTASRRIFDLHPALSGAASLVEFKQAQRAELCDGDECIVGLDVGSTTTKAVLMRKADCAITASVYLRTNGDPVEASRQCYASLREQTGLRRVAITGLGVTGSGRQIAALHALTENIVNEIIAHAAAAAYFDKEVDTIFEIGGQDAKYTFLTAGVPSDYAMNEACSAGTGSFLEESAYESLSVPMEEIGRLALLGRTPPNFTDQCSAFISSDVKQASQQGMDKNDILAGLVYSICMNYLNRVKGPRPVGKKIFMQGGVCYNRAVPYAMARLMKAPIVVPPDPGLMGALGVALEVRGRMGSGRSAPARFDLTQLIDRKAVKEGGFTCAGGPENCDRKCEISRIKVDGKAYPFGGICNRYYNSRFQRVVDTEKFDLVALRQKLLFEKYGVTGALPHAAPRKTVGIMLSFLTHSLFPLYSRFFANLGCTVVLPDSIDPEGVAMREAAFCLPAELSHGSLSALLKKDLDYIFIPQVMELPVPDVPTYSKTCVFVQGEPYYLASTFREEIAKSSARLLCPVIRMDEKYEEAEKVFVGLGRELGSPAAKSRAAFFEACARQYAFEEELGEHGNSALAYLDAHPETFGIALFGRPYNAFAGEANMGIPHKVASRGHLVIPLDMLPAHGNPVHPRMFWATGQKIMKAAQYVKERENLFGFYITNFSCGPDAFLLGFFRDILQSKPSLTLELDQHTADAGLDTRIEAALDIMTGFRAMRAPAKAPLCAFVPAKVHQAKNPTIISSGGEAYSLFSPNVEVLVPSMGRYGSEALAAVLRGRGVRAKALPIADKDMLHEGRRNASCKECLPYMVITGSFMTYLKNGRNPDVVSLLFMPTGGGPCRLGQYCVAIEQVLYRHKIGNAAMFTLTDENGYGGLGSRALLAAWQAIVASDLFEDVRSMLAVAARNKSQALAFLDAAWEEVLGHFEKNDRGGFIDLLSSIARRLSSIPLDAAPADIPVISLIGEIFVRRDEFSRKDLVHFLEEHGFRVRVAPAAEYLCYGNFVINSGLGERVFTIRERAKIRATSLLQNWWERRIKKTLAASGLYRFEMIDVRKTIEGVRHLVNVNFRGETILTIGLGMREILHDSCGVISIGPFGCMPSRVAEAMLKKEMNAEGKRRMFGGNGGGPIVGQLDTLPFFALETDGTAFPLQVEANLEAFVVQARRLHERMRIVE